jgi:hypothetical protein
LDVAATVLDAVSTWNDGATSFYHIAMPAALNAEADVSSGAYMTHLLHAPSFPAPLHAVSPALLAAAHKRLGSAYKAAGSPANHRLSLVHYYGAVVQFNGTQLVHGHQTLHEGVVHLSDFLAARQVIDRTLGPWAATLCATRA